MCVFVGVVDGFSFACCCYCRKCLWLGGILLLLVFSPCLCVLVFLGFSGIVAVFVVVGGVVLGSVVGWVLSFLCFHCWEFCIQVGVFLLES